MFSLLPVSTADSNVYVHCSQLNFTPTTPFESNIISLFTSLADSASVYNFNKFETSPQKDGVYGLFQCRGDLSSPNCKDCVANAITQLKTTCHMSTGGEIQLEGCFVKYDNTSFFGALDMMEVCRRCGPSIGYNSDILNRIDGALAYLVRGNGEYFHGGEFGSIQGVAQCVQDLSLSDCQDCLSEASGRLRSECVTSTWGDMYLGKCYIRYADQGSLNLDNNNGNSTPNKSSNKGVSVLEIVSLVISIISLVCAISTALLCRRKVNKLDRKVDRARYVASLASETAANAEKNAEKKAEKKAEELIKKFKSCYPCGPSSYPCGPSMPMPLPYPCLPC